MSLIAVGFLLPDDLGWRDLGTHPLSVPGLWVGSVGGVVSSSGGVAPGGRPCAWAGCAAPNIDSPVWRASSMVALFARQLSARAFGGAVSFVPRLTYERMPDG